MNTRIEVISNTRHWVQAELAKESSGHDWWHIHRVVEAAKRLAEEEGADRYVCELAALLHDIADEKVAGSSEAGEAKVLHWLQEQQVSEAETAHIMEIIRTMSFSSGVAQMCTLEGRVVQDADRLDALGAVGIARTFVYSGHKGRPMHTPGLAPRDQMTKAEYRTGDSSAINHFHEKLLKLKDRMNTATGRKLAEDRHAFMLQYLEQFHAEWNGER